MAIVETIVQGTAASIEDGAIVYNPPWWRFFVAFVGPLLVFLSLYLDGWLSFTAFVVVFGFIPVVEIFVRGSDGNLSAEDESVAAANQAYDWLLFSMVPIQYGLLTYYFWLMTQGGWTIVEIVGKTVGMGIGCGVLGLNVGHELGHRREKLPQTLSKILYLSTLYMHFFIEHNRGHHSVVATEEDPASAGLGENLYAFIPKSILGGYRSAWSLEAKRLKRRKVSFWSLENEMIRFQVIQVLAVFAVLNVFGWRSAVGFVVAALIGVIVLETVNYIEHYGLRREMKDNGRYERVREVHSWNSNHTVGRLLLFELSRHSDHHANPTRPYQLLRHFDESPQFPAGYPAMMVLAWLPPLWFWVMDPLIARWRGGAEMVPSP